MEYIIHHLDLLEAADQRSRFEQEIQVKIPALQQILHNYEVKPQLHFFIKKVHPADYTIFASLHLSGNDILIKETGSKTSSIVHSVLEKLLIDVKKQLDLEEK